MEITATNTNDLQHKTYKAVVEHGVRRNSRNGQVLVLPEPVTFKITEPFERVNFCTVRDANPFFHFVEAMTMLAGVNNVQMLGVLAKNMLGFSDNGITYNAFYGERIRRKWGDQLNNVIDILSNDWDSRQAVVQIWDPADLTKSTKDKACNMQLIFSVVPHEDGKRTVRMTSINRSNDAIWGFVNGANIVHFSYFHEYVCCALGLQPDSWYHFTNNLHVYTDNPKWDSLKDLPESSIEDYEPWINTPLFSDPIEKELFDRELDHFVMLCYTQLVENKHNLLNGVKFQSPFLQNVASQIVQLYSSYLVTGKKSYDPVRATEIAAHDWRKACLTWLQKREK